MVGVSLTKRSSENLAHSAQSEFAMGGRSTGTLGESSKGDLRTHSKRDSDCIGRAVL